jgi:two-component system chemotaxis response regulator CheY
MRVLVVDDMGAMRQNVKKAFIALGFGDLSDAKNGKDAWDTIIANHDIPGKRFEMAVVDWNMAPVSGLDLLQKIRKDPRVADLIFLMLTAEQMRDNIVLAVQSGVDEYIVKPFTPKIIKEKLTHLTTLKLSKIKREVDDYFVDLRSDNPKAAPEEAAFKSFRAKTNLIGQLSPWSHLTPLFMGRLCIRFGAFAEAEGWLRKAIRIDFGVADAHDLLSKVLKKMGKVEASLAELEVAAVERPNDAPLQQRLGEAYLKAGRLDRAVEILDQAVRLMNGAPPKTLAAGKTALGTALVEKGKAENDPATLDAGVGALEAAAVADPDLMAAHYNLMVAYKKSGRGEEAARVFDRIAAMEPKDAAGWVNLGAAFVEKEERQKALFAFNKADALADGRFPLYEAMGGALYRAGWYEEALTFIEKGAEAHPSEVASYNLKGLIYRHMDKYGLAVVEYEKAVKLFPDDAGLHFNLGVAYYKSGQQEKSGPFFAKAKELDPNLVEADKYLVTLKRA